MAAADTAFTVKVDGRTFTLDRILLGDWRMLKTEFGLSADDIVITVQNEAGEDVQILNVADPNVLVGLMVAALHHERPRAPVSELIAEVEALGMEDMSFGASEPETEDEDPTEAVAEEVAASPAKSSKSAKPRKQPGTQR